MTSLADSIKLLPWCISSSIPCNYMGDALVTAMQQGENVPATTAVPKPEESTALGPSSSPAHLTENPPPIIPLLPDFPFVGTPPGGAPIC